MVVLRWKESFTFFFLCASKRIRDNKGENQFFGWLNYLLHCHQLCSNLGLELVQFLYGRDWGMEASPNKKRGWRTLVMQSGSSMAQRSRQSSPPPLAGMKSEAIGVQHRCAYICYCGQAPIACRGLWCPAFLRQLSSPPTSSTWIYGCSALVEAICLMGNGLFLDCITLVHEKYHVYSSF